MGCGDSRYIGTSAQRIFDVTVIITLPKSEHEWYQLLRSRFIFLAAIAALTALAAIAELAELTAIAAHDAIAELAELAALAALAAIAAIAAITILVVTFTFLIVLIHLHIFRPLVESLFSIVVMLIAHLW